MRDMTDTPISPELQRAQIAAGQACELLGVLGTHLRGADCRPPAAGMDFAALALVDAIESKNSECFFALQKVEKQLDGIE